MVISNPRFSAILWIISFVLSIVPVTFGTIEFTRLIQFLCGMGACGLLVCAGGAMAQRSLTAPRICMMILLLWFLVVVSCVWSVAPGTTILYAGIFSIMPATFLALVFAAPAQQDVFLRTLLSLTVGAIALLGVSALMQVFVFPVYLVNGQVRYPFANPNAYAGLLTLGAFIVAGLYMNARSSWAGLYLLILFVLGAALAAIASQAATMTGLAGMAVMVVLMRGKISRTQAFSLAGIALAVVLAGFYMATIPGKTDIVTRLGYLADGKAGSWYNRLDIWQATLALIAQHPILGTGYKTFVLTYPAVRLPADTFSGGFVAHSDPLQFWAEIGIGGVVLFYAIGVMVLMRFARWMRATEKPDGLTIALFAGCLAFIAHTHVDFLLYTMPTMMLFALALGFLVLRTETDQTSRVAPFSFLNRLSRRAQGLAVLLPIVVFFYCFCAVMVGEQFASRATKLIKQEKIDDFADAVNKANRIGMGLNDRPYIMAATVPISILKNSFPAMGLDEQKALFIQADGLLDRALAINTLLPIAYYNRGELVRYLNPAVLPEDYPSARESFARALEIDPLHLPSRQALAEEYLKSGDKNGAVDILSGGLDWPYPNFDARPYFDQTETLALELGRGDIAERTAHARLIHQNRAARSDNQVKALREFKATRTFLP